MAAPLIEVCVDSVAGVLAAEEGGAARVELCADLLEGGTTPSPGMLSTALAHTALDVLVLVRPRGGDFLYTDLELETMLQDIDAVKAAGAAGVVLGVLDRHGDVDVERTRQLVARARPMQVTFHRAFDMTRDPEAALETLIDLGVDRVLTSGQKETASDSLDLLSSLVRQAGERIIVMPGGLDEGNISQVARATGARELHFAARSQVQSGMEHRNHDCGMGSGSPLDEFHHWETDVDQVRRFVAAVSA